MGPRITVRCDCGQVRYLGYGEVWTCESCAKRWNTAQIPKEDYDRVTRELRRYRAAAAATGILAAAVLIPLGVFVSFAFMVLLPGVLLAWSGFVAPRYRRRVGRRIGTLPSWQLRPE